jgi:hypothetical protein
MNNPDERQLEENTIITVTPVERGGRVKKGVDSFVIYRFLIKVFLIYILPALFLIILGFFEESVFKAECNVETESELCYWHIYMFLLFFYYLFPIPFVIPTAIFIVLEIIKRVIKKYKPTREEVKRVLKTDL